MNTLNNWISDEIMVSGGMKDMRREADTVRMLQEAGLSEPRLHDRVNVTLGRALVKLGERLQRKYSGPRSARHVANGKYAG